MAATDAVPVPRKNVAYRVTFPIFDADGDLVSGATGLDSEVSKDQGTFADCTNEATEIATASGMYFLDLTAAEMNADTVAVIVKTTSVGAKTTPIVIYPAEDGDIRADAVMLSGDAAAADNAELFFEGAFVSGNVSDASPAAGDFDGNAGLSASDDFYNGAVLVFTMGTLKGIGRKISDYTGTTKTFVFSGPVGAPDAPFPVAPANADTFIVIGRVR